MHFSFQRLPTRKHIFVIRNINSLVIPYWTWEMLKVYETDIYLDLCFMGSSLGFCYGIYGLLWLCLASSLASSLNNKWSWSTAVAVIIGRCSEISSRLSLRTISKGGGDNHGFLMVWKAWTFHQFSCCFLLLVMMANVFWLDSWT